MASRKQAKGTPKISFAVDRDEIDISSDWVQAIMQEKQAASLPAESIAEIQSATVAEDAAVENSATVVMIDVATVEDIATVENKAAVVINATVEKNTTVEFCNTVAEDAAVEIFATVADLSISEAVSVHRNDSATVAEKATVEYDAAVENNATVAARVMRLRPIHRITDALTPGQFSVYSLMFAKADPQPEPGIRLFRGGYLDLVRLTGLSKRGIQNVIGELIQKTVVSIHQAPGYHRSQTTVYEVPPEDVVLKRWFDQGLQYASGKSKHLIHSATVVNSATVA